MPDFFYFLAIFLVFCVVVNYLLRSYSYHGPISDHFDGVHFSNIKIGEVTEGGARHHRLEKTNAFILFVYFVKKHFDSIRWHRRELSLGSTKPENIVGGSEIVITFVGHSTVLLQTEGLNILTDPMWATRAGPYGIFGPRRYTDPGVRLEDLPKIDFILLSHNHYDHMDIPTLRKISKRDNPPIYTPLGNTKYLRSAGIFGGQDMDWGQSEEFSKTLSILTDDQGLNKSVAVKKIIIDCVPAQHFSARAISDNKKTLWGGFVLHLAYGDIYFAGDTGYGPFVSRIAKAYPAGFRFALLPIGSYEPPKIFATAHMSPDDAVVLYKDLKIQEAMAIHWGSFDLAFDDQDEPAERLKNVLSAPENSSVKFHALQNGEKMVLSKG